ncbi:DUF4214 domain-containing protein [Paraburkholderia oxyphila]|uniref:DUF4214 domain-containing protein n=1 Tax=Paraburkholderia oxyphila TaxID=614212 RepID=UPI000489AA00|nr:DUF4214 domain-containing protein [Paraburkholderia oxyphila]
MYSAVETIKVKAIKGSNIQGWAVPAEGARCACLMFYAAETLVAAARADRFDAEAARVKVRDGWCKFDITLSQKHFVLADTLSVRCAVSANELTRIGFSDLEFDAAPKLAHTTPEAIIAAQIDQRYTDCTPFEPLIERFAQRLNEDEFVAFAYQFVLERRPDLVGIAHYRKFAKYQPMTIIRELMQSEEYKQKRTPGLMGVFSHGFPQLPLFQSGAAR